MNPINFAKDFYSKHTEFVRYGTVGGIGLVLAEVLLYLFTSLGVNVYLGYIVDWEITIVVGFVMHEKFTFRHSAKQLKFLHRLGTFEVIQIVYRSINYVIYVVLVYFGMNIYIALLLAVIMAFGFNWLAAKHITWARPKL